MIKEPKLRYIPKNDLDRHIVNLFHLHTNQPDEVLDDIGRSLVELSEADKLGLLADIEEYLGKGAKSLVSTY